MDNSKGIVKCASGPPAEIIVQFKQEFDVARKSPKDLSYKNFPVWKDTNQSYHATFDGRGAMKKR